MDLEPLQALSTFREFCCIIEEFDDFLLYSVICGGIGAIIHNDDPIRGFVTFAYVSLFALFACAIFLWLV